MLNLLYVLFLVCLSGLGSSCSKERTEKQENPKGIEAPKRRSIEFLKQELNKPRSDYVMVVAHRGAWQNAPENSIPGIEKAMEMGVDMVEMDVRMSKDSVLVLMHDETLNRTTTGQGLVSDHTLAELKQLSLKVHTGQVTEWKVPTLEEAMLFARGKILVNIDKGRTYIKEVGEVLKKTGTLDIAVVKSGMKVQDLLPIIQPIDGAPFMAVISLDKNANPLKKINDYLKHYPPKLMEISFQTENSEFFSQYENLLDRGVKIWMTPCGAQFCAGHDDNSAINGDPEGSWGWLLDHGATILLTNQPKELIAYLRNQGLRD